MQNSLQFLTLLCFTLLIYPRVLNIPALSRLIFLEMHLLIKNQLSCKVKGPTQHVKKFWFYCQVFGISIVIAK